MTLWSGGWPSAQMIGGGSSNGAWASISQSSVRFSQILASMNACKSATSTSSIVGSWRGALASLCIECTSRASAREFAGAPDLTFAAASLNFCVDRVGLSARLHDPSSPDAEGSLGRQLCSSVVGAVRVHFDMLVD